MTDEQYHAHSWLSRMWNAEVEINQLVFKRGKILDDLSGIGKYDAEYIPTQNGENSTESKNIEYSLLCEKIEKKSKHLSEENCRTHNVIEKVDNTMYRGLLEAIYINRLTLPQAGKLYNYELTRTKFYRNKALDAVSQFIPQEVIVE